ncbi:MAG: hypothetical protein Q9M14_01480 [Mariprofundaceae bacterium]|nr:hypothetical protein [Mariprofundaceae bacterium]
MMVIYTQKTRWRGLALLVLCWLPAAAMACDKPNESFEYSLMALPNEAFDWGAEGLGASERKELLKKQESATYTLEKKKKPTWVIHNKYAKDSVFEIRRYAAEKAEYLCVHTSYSQNNVVECWQGSKKVDLLPDVGITSFLKQPEQFSATALKDLKKTYPVSLSFGEKNTIAAGIRLWMNPPLEDADVHSTLHLIWQAQGMGRFVVNQDTAIPSAHKVRCFKHPSPRKYKRSERGHTQ